MEKLEIEFSKTAVKEYKRLPKDYQSLIDRALKKLSDGHKLKDTVLVVTWLKLWRGAL